MERNLVIAIILVIIIIFILASISPRSDYNSGTTCPYQTIRSDCLGIKFPSSVLALGGPSQISCLGLVSNTKCYINECSSNPNDRLEISCDLLTKDLFFECRKNINVLTEDKNSNIHCCNLYQMNNMEEGCEELITN